MINDKSEFDGKLYFLVERLKQPYSEEGVIICTDEEGIRYACLENLWYENNAVAFAPTVTQNFFEAKVNSHSSPTEKIALFRSLFRGREDVYAKRYYNLKSENSGYVPACKNEWVSGVCDKKTYSCGRCPNRSFFPLTDNIVYKHLEGKDEYARDVIGIYPILEDDMTFFVAVDFDGDNWKQDISAFRVICTEYDVSVAVERSRSGNGAHAWFFFNDPVTASSARKLGSGLLTRAMDKRHEIKFKSYDRLFPNQDSLPNGGFGNLIALPLQGHARKNGNSLFVDEHFNIYPDQWRYLSSITKISETELEKLIAVICSRDELGELAASGEEKPWTTQKQAVLTESDFPARVEVTLANGIYIKKDGVSQKALNKMKRLGAFKNPDFFKSQAMRLPTYNKKRIIDATWETSEYLCIPRGCLDYLKELLTQIGVSFQLNDERCRGRSINVEFLGELREEQNMAAFALLGYENGVLSATTAFGKTVIGAYLIAKRKINTLILVHSSALLSQWEMALGQFLNVNEVLPEQPKKRGRKKERSIIGQIGSGKNTLRGIVDVAIMQSLFSGDEVKELVQDYGMVICDECHHVPADSFERILAAIKAKYVYGLTATPQRQDGHHPVIFMQCGPIRYRVDAKEQADKRDFAHHIIPKITRMRIPGDDIQIQDVYTKICESDARNIDIVKDVLSALQEGRTPLILTERKEHAESLALMLSNSCPSVFLLVGSDSQKRKREKLEALKTFPKDAPLVIVATGKYIGEGFDEPRLDTLFLAMPFSWKGTLAQYAGRLHRSFTGKREVRIYDYVDIHVKMLERMYHKRLRGYAELGYQVKGSYNDEKTDIIFDCKSYISAFSKDISQLSNKALIICPFIKRAKVIELLKLIGEPLADKAEITIITRPPEEYKLTEQSVTAELIKLLEESGVKIITKSNTYQKYAVIDQKIVWYGNISFLSFGNLEESTIRFENPDIAGELIDAANE